MGKLVSYRRGQQPLPHELLLMYRQRCHLTQNQLAAHLGLKSDRMVQKWESGLTMPTASRLQSLLELYLNTGVLVEGKEREEARELWRSVKDMFEQNSTSYETYPIFDEGWFEALLKNKLNLPEYSPTQPLPTSSSTRNKALTSPLSPELETSAVVTLLFTNIEGCTRLWEHYSQTMAQSLARHNTLVGGIIEAQGGYVFKRVGDACFATFTSAEAALQAALSIQHALAAQSWDQLEPLKLRIAVC